MDKRYFRQTIMDEIGQDGQIKLANSKVLVIGAGGLGSPVIYYLTVAGIGTLGIVDNDKISITNLNRQILHNEIDLNMPKVDSAETKINKLNSTTKVEKYNLLLNEENISNIIKKYDLVVDCVDNIKTRYVVNDACYKFKKPLIEAGIMGFDGFVMTIIPPFSPCYRCIYPDISDETVPKPIPVFGATAGVIGSIQVIEAVKVLLHMDSVLTSSMLFVDLVKMLFEKIEIGKNPECSTCK
jgi:adenylyltransferase/sulfurtransferase